MTEEELKLKADRFMLFLDKLTESQGFKDLCNEFGIDPNKKSERELTPVQIDETGCMAYRMFLGFGG
ncbi:MAG: hypothetical protein FWB73_05935 [Treponema sp.]|nr:hypothetical protein [Treponema sp.]